MIRGERVVLRPVEETDHASIQAWQNHPEVWFWMDYERPFSLEDIAESEARAREEGVPLIIEVDGKAIGRIGLNGFRRRDRICSLYVFVGDADAAGNGYGPDAIRALLAYAFERFDLARVELWSLAANERAIRSYERCGFAIDATLPARSFKDGEWHDRVIMSVTREEFEALQRSGFQPSFTGRS
jgi:RimJ/RimL family protein N-acetyltransferase